jgi:flavin-dependent dehydrogenase
MIGGHAYMSSTDHASDEYDVVVAGGGPSATALTTLLAREGHRCLIVERGKFPRYHIGESLIPHTYGTLDRLGLLPKLKASSYPEKHSVRFVSRRGTESDPFYFSERIPGDGSRTWQVERSTFDKMMLDHARENGVEAREETTVSEVLFDGDRAIGVRVDSGDGVTEDIHARVTVDATGARTLLGRQLGVRERIPSLSKGTLWSYYRGGARLDGIDAGETTIFMIPDRGWFWYIPLPDDIVSVGIVASPEYLFGDVKEGTGDAEAILDREVAKCSALADRLSKANRVDRVRGTRELAYVNRQTSGDGWVMIGDARAFLDPIYSSGLFLALASGELAADSIHAALEADDLSGPTLGAFEGALLEGLEVVRRLIYAFYDPEFSFGAFADRFPAHRPELIDCLTGDVVGKDMSAFLGALAEMTPVPDPL